MLICVVLFTGLGCCCGELVQQFCDVPADDLEGLRVVYGFLFFAVKGGFGFLGF